VSRCIRLDDEALGELVGAARWNEERERGRGTEFSDAAFGRIETLNSFPNAGTPIWGVNGALLAHQIRLQRYPYVVVYAVAEKEIGRSRSRTNGSYLGTGPPVSSRSPHREFDDRRSRRTAR
jgi:hypothetical protein